MNHRSRLLTALRRRQPDRVPFDMRFTLAARAAFVLHTGAADPAEFIDADYRFAPVPTPPQLPDFSAYFRGRVPDWPKGGWTDWAPRLVETSTPPYPHFFRLGPQTALNEWGEYRIYDAEWNYHRKVYPLDAPDCTPEQILDFPFPDVWADSRYAGLAEAIAAIHERGLAALLFLEMTVFEKAWRIRGFENLLADFILRPETAECLLDAVAVRTGHIAARYAAAGVDIIRLGDDIGAERSLLVRPAMWRRFLKPRLAAVIAAARKAKPDVLIFYHSDGEIEAVIPDLIEVGVDILNPIQPETLDVARLKRDFGDRLAFWGGIGVQTTLPFGTPGDVRAAVRRLITDAGRGGGLLVAPSHVVEPDVPWENIVALIEAVREYGAY